MALCVAQGSLAESLGAVRTVLRATRLALEVVNASSSPPEDAEPHCARALARALGCGACASLPPATGGKGMHPSTSNGTSMPNACVVCPSLPFYYGVCVRAYLSLPPLNT